MQRAEEISRYVEFSPDQIFGHVQDQVKLETGVDIDKEAFCEYYLPLANNWIKDRQDQKNETHVVGISAAQGTGKTVFASIMRHTLAFMDYKVVVTSIDDFYKTHKARTAMPEHVSGNPLYENRGLPGTHDVNLLVEAITDAMAGRPFWLPRYNKSAHEGRGDRSAEVVQVDKQLDFFILEGWCVGLEPIDLEAFNEVMETSKYVFNILNEIDLERTSVPAALALIESYQEIWDLVHSFTFLRAPIEGVIENRQEQEARMIERTGKGMSPDQIEAFVRPYLLFTLLINRFFPDRENLKYILDIGGDHLPTKMSTT
ncbi:MAG: hypothetical protein O2840_04120 [bacterium]|nr:hypothetical protein [bacterium]